MTEDASKKRGRKKKDNEEVVQPITEVAHFASVETENDTITKKRGRKPKGGKLIQNISLEQEPVTQPANIILHLRCSLKDIQQQDIRDPLSYNPSVPPDIMSYEDDSQKFAFYSKEEIATSQPDIKPAYTEIICKKCSLSLSEDGIQQSAEEAEDTVSLKDIHQKLKRLRVQFYKNTLNDKKSACFWCTCDFDNEPCYIPKYEMDDTVCGYGCFCRPECAVGFLMNESINDSTKFERYQLLNQIYSQVYGFKKNIKPAPSPFYLLDKFYGNLSIQEYRKLLKTEHMLLVLEKPLTRILPELHDDNDEFILNIYGGVKANNGTTGGQYKVKRQSEKTQGPTKNSIIKDKFNLPGK